MACSKIEILCAEIHIVLLTVQTVSRGIPGFVRVLGRLSVLLVLVLGRLRVLPVYSGHFVCACVGGSGAREVWRTHGWKTSTFAR